MPNQASAEQKHQQNETQNLNTYLLFQYLSMYQSRSFPTMSCKHKKIELMSPISFPMLVLSAMSDHGRSPCLIC